MSHLTLFILNQLLLYSHILSFIVTHFFLLQYVYWRYLYVSTYCIFLVCIISISITKFSTHLKKLNCQFCVVRCNAHKKFSRWRLFIILFKVFIRILYNNKKKNCNFCTLIRNPKFVTNIIRFNMLVIILNKHAIKTQASSENIKLLLLMTQIKESLSLLCSHAFHEWSPKQRMI